MNFEWEYRQWLFVIEINTKEFYCDGPEDGEHPRVYYVIDDDTITKTCMYCNLTYIYRPSEV